MKNILLFLIIITGLLSCKTSKSEYELLSELYNKPSNEWPKPTIDKNIEWEELAILPKPNFGKIKPSKELIKLGKQLFFDNRLSQTKQFSCASCHHPDQNFTDNRKVSMGFELKEGNRNSPTIVNLSNNKHFFWDGRASSLEEQVLGPLVNPVEMNTSLDTVLARVSSIKGYQKSFKKIYKKNTITLNNITEAIAVYEKSLVSRLSKFDYFLKGKKELTFSELRGLHLFRTKAMCMNCHNGANFTDNNFHNIGLTYYGRKYEDLGRYNVTKKSEDIGKFKTPNLRDVMRTRPWMHNGLFDNMNGILNMYNAGMPHPKPNDNQINDTLFPVTSPLLKELNLTKTDKQDIISFLHAISSSSLKVSKPKLPE